MKRTISVVGTGRAVSVPDVADIRFGVAVSRPTVAEARAEAATAATRLVTALTGLGVDRSDIRTASLVVQPEYDYRDGLQQLRGQSVSHQLAVVVRDLERLGSIADGGLAAGATSLDGVVLRSADPGPPAEAARVAAFADARARATTLAREAGAVLGPVVAIAEADPIGGPRPMPFARAALAAEAAPTPIEAGQGEVVVRLEVVFSIG